MHGGPFHSQNPEAYFMNVPGLKIVAPGTPRDAKGLMTAAIRDPDPVIYLEHKFLYRRLQGGGARRRLHGAHRQGARRPRGQGRVDHHLRGHAAGRPGGAEAAREGRHRVEVVDLRTLLPLDEEAILATAAKTGKVLVLHEATRTGGPGGEIAALVAERAFEYLDAPVVRLAPPDTPVPYSPPLEEDFLPERRDGGQGHPGAL